MINITYHRKLELVVQITIESLINKLIFFSVSVKKRDDLAF